MATIKDYKPMSDDDILKALEVNIKAAVGYYDSELSRERRKVTDYYNGKLPRPTHDGNSKYVSQDVYTGVQSMAASLLETFAAGSNIAKFSPSGPEDVKTAEICSVYTDYVLFRQNSAIDIFQSVILSGLMSRVGVAKVFWDMRTETEEEEFTNLTSDELDLLLSEDDVELLDSEENEIGLLSGTIERTYDTSQVAIESIAPEQFIIEPQAAMLMWISVRTGHAKA